MQLPGNRHDSKGLYEFLNIAFSTHLVGDNAYWPNCKLRAELEKHDVKVTAATRSNWDIENTAEEKNLLKKRFHVERYISLFDSQFNGTRTLNRSSAHYHVRRMVKAVAYNLSRYLNEQNSFPKESIQHLRLAS